jgi:hypothetical protein
MMVLQKLMMVLQNVYDGICKAIIYAGLQVDAQLRQKTFFDIQKSIVKSKIS